MLFFMWSSKESTFQAASASVVVSDPVAGSLPFSLKEHCENSALVPIHGHGHNFFGAFRPVSVYHPVKQDLTRCWKPREARRSARRKRIAAATDENPDGATMGDAVGVGRDALRVGTPSEVDVEACAEDHRFRHWQSYGAAANSRGCFHHAY
jgi:hypothetical protein